MDDLTNLGNPQNNLRDWQEQNAPRITPLPDEAITDDLFADTVKEKESPREIPGSLPGNAKDQESWNH